MSVLDTPTGCAFVAYHKTRMAFRALREHIATGTISWRELGAFLSRVELVN